VGLRARLGKGPRPWILSNKFRFFYKFKLKINKILIKPNLFYCGGHRKELNGTALFLFLFFVID
jgi:hypothetical protein